MVPRIASLVLLSETQQESQDRDGNENEEEHVRDREDDQTTVFGAVSWEHQEVAISHSTNSSSRPILCLRGPSHALLPLPILTFFFF